MASSRRRLRCLPSQLDGQPSQDVSDGMGASHENVDLVTDADGFCQVLAGTSREKHKRVESRVDASQATNNDILDKVQHAALCQHIVRNIPSRSI